MLDPKQCKNGKEQYEQFFPVHKPKTAYIQYDYRTKEGKLFSCIAPTLEECRNRKERWLRLI